MIYDMISWECSFNHWIALRDFFTEKFSFLMGKTCGVRLRFSIKSPQWFNQSINQYYKVKTMICWSIFWECVIFQSLSFSRTNTWTSTPLSRAACEWRVQPPALICSRWDPWSLPNNPWGKPQNRLEMVDVPHLCRRLTKKG